MLCDRFSGVHSGATVPALADYETAVRLVAAHQPGAGEALSRARASAPHFIAATALDGFAQVLLARGETLTIGRDRHRTAVDLLAATGCATAGEKAMVAALGLAVDGYMLAAADRLSVHLDDVPTDLTALKLAHALRFMAGDVPAMLTLTRRLAPAWSAATPGYGFFMGCHAFGLCEQGLFGEAERVGRVAVAAEPADAWGLHAVAHVFEMEGRTGEGIAWLDSSRQMWAGCNNFAFHIAWHLALFHLARNEFDYVLDLYDRDVRPATTEDFRDVANAAALLWRLEEHGVPVGARWHELHEVARQRLRDTNLVFASLHHLLTLLAVRDRQGAQQLVAALEQRAAAGPGDQSIVAAQIGVPLARVLLSGGGPASFGRLAGELQSLGGSRAQRDVFLRTLALLAAQAGDGAGLGAVLDVRHRQRRADQFSAMAALRCAASQPTRAA